MAGDWIKMRSSLLTNPKVNGIARILESDKDVTKALTTGAKGCMSEYVTRYVMRNVTVSLLLTLWGSANEHTKDGVFKNADLQDIDDIVGLPNFATAMQSVGWLIFDETELTVTLPNFNEYNTCGRDRVKEKAAERQKRYREKKKNEGVNSNGFSNVTRDVTSNGREEKRREENTNKKNKQKKTFTPPKLQEVEQYAQSRNATHLAKQFFDYFDTGSWKDAKGNQVKNWKQKFITWQSRDTTPAPTQTVYARDPE